MYDWRDDKQYQELAKSKKDLMEKYPLLYTDKDQLMQTTCMYWGLDIGPGWLKLVDELSAKLEQQIKEWLEENKEKAVCVWCSRRQDQHTKFYTFLEDGNTFLPIEDVTEYSATTIVDPENIFVCEEYRINHPRASQVKEKYGSLRFYMSSSTEEMEDLITEAEVKSEVICEDCGADGELCSSGSWFRTICPTCVSEYNTKGRLYVQCSKKEEK